jgi:hypothetical protein
MVAEMLSRGSIVLMAYLAAACGSEEGSGSADGTGPRTLNSEPFMCGAVATVEGGLEHTFGETVACGGGPFFTVLTEVVGPVAANGSVPMVTLYFEFDPLPAEGQTGPVNVSWVNVRQQVPSPGDTAPTMQFEWGAGPGACSMNLKSSIRDTRDANTSAWIWINGEGTCNQSLAPVPPNTKPPVTVSAFAIKSYVWPVQ